MLGLFSIAPDYWFLKPICLNDWIYENAHKPCIYGVVSLSLIRNAEGCPLTSFDSPFIGIRGKTLSAGHVSGTQSNDSMELFFRLDPFAVKSKMPVHMSHEYCNVNKTSLSYGCQETRCVTNKLTILGSNFTCHNSRSYSWGRTNWEVVLLGCVSGYSREVSISMKYVSATYSRLKTYYNKHMKGMWWYSLFIEVSVARQVCQDDQAVSQRHTLVFPLTAPSFAVMFFSWDQEMFETLFSWNQQSNRTHQ